jgi:hypothetical protein
VVLVMNEYDLQPLLQPVEPHVAPSDALQLDESGVAQQLEAELDLPSDTEQQITGTNAK